MISNKLPYSALFFFFAWVSFLSFLYSDVKPISDFADYWSLAKNLAAFEGYFSGGEPHIYRPVGYPFFLSLFLFFLPDTIWVPKILHAILSAGMIVFVYQMIITVTRHTKVARVFALLFAAYPSLWAYGNLVGTEILSAFLVCLLVHQKICPTYWSWISDKWRPVLVGMTMGLLALTKPQFVVFIGFYLLLELYQKGVKHLSSWVTILVTGFILTSWGVRNYLHFGHFIPLSATGGISLLWGNNPHATGGWMPDKQVPAYQKILAENHHVIERSQAARQYAVSWIVNHPGAFVSLIPKKFWAVWNQDNMGLFWNMKGQEKTTAVSFHVLQFALAPLNMLIYFSMVLLGFLGAGILWVRRSSLVLTLPLLTVLLIHIFFHGQPRYHFPVMPLMFVLAAVVVGEIIQVIVNKYQRVKV